MSKLPTQDMIEELSQLKFKMIGIDNLSMDNPEISQEIDSRISKAYDDEMRGILYDNDEEAMEAILDGGVVEVSLIPKDEIFHQIIEEKRAEVLSDVHELYSNLWQKCKDGVKPIIRDYKIKFSNGDFESVSYEKARNHGLKKKNRKGYFEFTRKDYETFEKQKGLLAKILSVNTSESTIRTLRNYNFLDESLKDVVKRFYYPITSETTCYLHDADPINHYINWLRPDAQEGDIVEKTREKNAKKREDAKVSEKISNPRKAV